MHLGIFAKTFAGTTPRAVFGAARAAGYRAVQYNMACCGIGALPAVIAPEAADAVRAAAQATGVAVAAVSATYNMIHPDPGQRAAGRAGFAAIAAAAPAMGTRLVTLCTGSRDAADPWRHHPGNAGPEAWRDLLDEFARLIPLAEAHDLILCVEPERANVIATADRARDLIATLQSDRIGIVLDPANLFEAAEVADRGRIIAGAVDMLADRIVIAHAKDRHADGRFAAAGQGCVDFAAFIGALHRAGFRGPLVTHGLSADEAPGVAEFLRGCLAALPG